jgi:hypothetical protein
MQTCYAIKKEKNKILKIKTAAYTILPLTEDMWATFSNSGMSGSGTAGGVVTFALPAAKVGMGFRFLVQAACPLRIDPNGNETIALPSTGAQGSAGKYIWADAIGESVEIECLVAGTWNVGIGAYTGTWTAES